MIILQSPTVMAFRKRLKSFGYKEISIYKIRPFAGYYLVSAIEPLSGTKVSVKMGLCMMQNSFRR